MKTQKIKNLEVRPPNSKQAFTINTPKHLPKLHQLLLVVGMRGAGKGVSTTSLIKRYVDAGIIDDVFLVSPTYKSNEDLFLQFGDAFNPDTNVIEPTKDASKLIEQHIQDLADEYQQYLNDMNEYKELLKKMKNRGLDENELDYYYEKSILDDEGAIVKPQYRFKNKPPRCYVIIDDAIGSEMMIGNGAKELTQLLLKHRHIGELEKGVLGFSCAMMSQTLKTTQGGIPRAIRENCTHLILVGKSKDEKITKQIHEEVGKDLTFEEFEMLLNRAIDGSNPHDFLFMDFAPKCSKKMYRKNFDTYITLPNQKCNCKK